ncbi:MAG: hypothetical protein GY847_02270 [Proteobacteria bacterium]|nr:hypothetical protein [Pseudomonadota bacterium]
MLRFLILTHALLITLACTCAGESQESSDVQSLESQSGSESEDELSSNTKDNGDMGGKATLAQGTTTVLGLGIPRGMMPAPAPPKVYRFEGTHHVAHVTGFIREQVSTRKSMREGSGYIFRNARVRHPKGKATGGDLLAIRIFKGQKGGATIDIWLEREYAKRLPSRGSSSYYRSSHSYGSSGRHTTRVTTTAKRKRKKAKRDTMRVMYKLMRKDELDSNDYEQLW